MRKTAGIHKHALDVAVVFEVIRYQDELPARPQDPTELVHESGLDQPAGVVLALRPGVGKIGVNAPDRMIGQAVAKKEGGIGGQHADVRQPSSADAVGGIEGIGPGPFDPQEVEFRPGSRARQQEGAFADSYLDLHRPVVAEDRRQVNGSGR